MWKEWKERTAGYCTVDDCSRRAWGGLGLCWGHYSRKRRGKTVNWPPLAEHRTKKEMIALMAKLQKKYDAGMSISAIYRDTGVAQSTMHRHLTKRKRRK